MNTTVVFSLGLGSDAVLRRIAYLVQGSLRGAFAVLEFGEVETAVQGDFITGAGVAGSEKLGLNGGEGCHLGQVFQGIDKTPPFRLKGREKGARILVATRVLLGVRDAGTLLVD